MPYSAQQHGSVALSRSQELSSTSYRIETGLNPFPAAVTPTHRGGPRGARVSRRDLRATRRCIRVVVMGP